MSVLRGRERALRSIDTVLVDVDGTIVDSTFHQTVAWSRAFADCGLRPPTRVIHRALGLGSARLVAEVAGEHVEHRIGADLWAAWERHYEALVRETHAVDGAADLVRAIRHRGLTVALASSGPARFTDLALESAGLGRADFDAIVTSDDVEEAKPDPQVLQVALERAGGTAAVVVGDTPYDVVAASRLGADCVGVLTGGVSAEELRSAGAVLVVDSVADLVDLDWRALNSD